MDDEEHNSRINDVISTGLKIKHQSHATAKNGEESHKQELERGGKEVLTRLRSAVSRRIESDKPEFVQWKQKARKKFEGN